MATLNYICIFISINIMEAPMTAVIKFVVTFYLN